MNACALGWDNHRKFSKVSVMEQTPDGEIHAVERARLEHDDKDAMRAWLSHLDPEMPVALEATFGWPWVADLLEELGHPVHLGHPPVIRALAKHEAKTDRCDSDRLGKFQLRGILPESSLAPPEVRQRRERTRYRMALSALRTAVKNRAQAILHRFGILHDFSDLFGKAGRQFLDNLELPDGSRQALNGYLHLLDTLTLGR
jgi:transposase